MYLKLTLLAAFVLQIVSGQDSNSTCYTTDTCPDPQNCTDLCADTCCYNCGDGTCHGGSCIDGQSCQLPSDSSNGDPGYCKTDNLPCRSWTDGCYGQQTCANLCENECCGTECLGYSYYGFVCDVGEVGTGEGCVEGFNCTKVNQNDPKTCQMDNGSVSCRSLAYCQANFMNPCYNMCPNEYCVGGDATNHFYGTCSDGYGCYAITNTADSNTTQPMYGQCLVLSTVCNTTINGCFNVQNCTNVCVGGPCGVNATYWYYDNTTDAPIQKSYGTWSCMSGKYHCNKKLGETAGVCEDHKYNDKKLMGAACILLLLLLIICCCCCCCYHHHKKMKEEEAIHEAMLAQEQAQANGGVSSVKMNE